MDGPKFVGRAGGPVWPAKEELLECGPPWLTNEVFRECATNDEFGRGASAFVNMDRGRTPFCRIDWGRGAFSAFNVDCGRTLLSIDCGRGFAMREGGGAITDDRGAAPLADIGDPKFPGPGDGSRTDPAVMNEAWSSPGEDGATEYRAALEGRDENTSSAFANETGS